MPRSSILTVWRPLQISCLKCIQNFLLLVIQPTHFGYPKEFWVAFRLGLTSAGAPRSAVFFLGAGTPGASTILMA